MTYKQREKREFSFNSITMEEYKSSFLRIPNSICVIKNERRPKEEVSDSCLYQTRLVSHKMQVEIMKETWTLRYMTNIER